MNDFSLSIRAFIFVWACSVVVLIALLIVLLIVLPSIRRTRYHQSSYYQKTHRPYWRFDKGSEGEYELYRHIQFVEQYGWQFLFNVYIPKKNGQTTEIDVILISSKGIFVFESKNYGGWVLGTENQSEWMQTFPNGERYPFYNPILQNNGHIYHLTNFLNLKSKIPFYSIVAFSDRCSLQKITVHSKDTYVINYSDIANIIQAICQKNPSDVLNASDINRIYNTLYYHSQATDERKSVHNAEVCSARYTPPARCPLCGGKLQLRTTQKGKNKGNKFYGCSNFPTCQYIRHVDNQ